jgi:hypothetical protein
MVVQRGVVGRVGAMRVIAPSRGFVPQAQTAQKLLKHAPAPPRNYGQRLELVESTSPQCLTCHCTDKAGYIYSAPLHICQVAPLLLRKHRGWARDQNKYFATAPGHNKRALLGAHSSRGWNGKTTPFSRSRYTRVSPLLPRAMLFDLGPV